MKEAGLNPIVFYSCMAVFLLLFETIYVHMARRMHINDRPTLRSSHSKEIPTGGGVIIYLCVLVFISWHTYMANITWWTLLGSCTVLAIVSFIDDVRPLPAESRLMIQAVVISFVFRHLIHEDTFNIFLIILLLGTGLVNAYNFMDGINGMLVCYSTVILGTLLYYIGSLHLSPSTYYSPQMFEGLVLSLLIATIILMPFNLRRNALVFSGDVGSITMGFCIMFVMACTIVTTGDASVIVFLAVYAVDTVYTILQRLFEGDNITTPHRKHLYQVLVHRYHKSHLMVSACYALLQLAVNVVYFIIPSPLHWTYDITVLTLLTIVYFILKSGHRQN